MSSGRRPLRGASVTSEDLLGTRRLQKSTRCGRDGERPRCWGEEDPRSPSRGVGTDPWELLARDRDSGRRGRGKGSAEKGRKKTPKEVR